MENPTAEHGAGWHIDKRISVGHLITTLTVTVAVIAWSFRMEGRINLNEVKIQNNEQAIKNLRVDGLSQNAEIIRRLEVMDEKLDRRLEQLSVELHKRQ